MNVSDWASCFDQRDEAVRACSANGYAGVGTREYSDRVNRSGCTSSRSRLWFSIAANSATGFDGPTNDRRTGAPITIAGAFFVPAHLWRLCAGDFRVCRVPIVPVRQPAHSCHPHSFDGEPWRLLNDRSNPDALFPQHRYTHTSSLETGRNYRPMSGLRRLNVTEFSPSKTGSRTPSTATAMVICIPGP